MQGSLHPTPPTPPPLDLDAYSEATRRRLYDLTKELNFPKEPHNGDEFFPDYSAEDARLSVFRAFGRWFCAWRPLEDLSLPHLPPERRWVVLRIVSNPQAPDGVSFDEV